MVSICIFLMMNNVEHLLMYLLAIWMSSSEKCLFMSSDHSCLSFFFFFNIYSFLRKREREREKERESEADSRLQAVSTEPIVGSNP